MKLYLRKTPTGLKPYFKYDESQYLKLKEGIDYRCEIKRVRNSGNHRRFFALMNLTFENQEFYKTLDDLREVVICKAGYYHKIETDKGIIVKAKSISFSSMDEMEFKELFDKCIDVCIEMVGFDKQDILNEIAEFV